MWTQAKTGAVGGSLGRLAAMSLFALAMGGWASGETANKPQALYGDPVPFGEGTARVYVLLEGETPVETGISLSSAALVGLPADGGHGGMVMPDGHSTFETVLPMPEGNPTPFEHAVIDWNPVGHAPFGTYNVPHFDFHFYTISLEERHGIDPTDPAFLEKGRRAPDAANIPAGYVLPDMPPVPHMGAHWLNPASPELKEEPEAFTHTFIYGSWDGRLIFAEPMITKAFLEGRTTVTVPIPVAENYDPAGYYPASYAVRWDEAASEYRIALSDLAWRD